jgi:hypothetical protein
VYFLPPKIAKRAPRAWGPLALGAHAPGAKREKARKIPRGKTTYAERIGPQKGSQSVALAGGRANTRKSRTGRYLLYIINIIGACFACGIPGSRPFGGRLTAGSGAHPTPRFQVSVSLKRLRLAPPPGLRCPGSSSIRRQSLALKNGHPVATKNWQHKPPRAGCTGPLLHREKIDYSPTAGTTSLIFTPFPLTGGKVSRLFAARLPHRDLQAPLPYRRDRHWHRKRPQAKPFAE